MTTPKGRRACQNRGRVSDNSDSRKASYNSDAVRPSFAQVSKELDCGLDGARCPDQRHLRFHGRMSEKGYGPELPLTIDSSMTDRVLL